MEGKHIQGHISLMKFKAYKKDGMKIPSFPFYLAFYHTDFKYTARKCQGALLRQYDCRANGKITLLIYLALVRTVSNTQSLRYKMN